MKPASLSTPEYLAFVAELKERELEDRLVARLRDFILKLGYGSKTLPAVS